VQTPENGKHSWLSINLNEVTGHFVKSLLDSYGVEWSDGSLDFVADIMFFQDQLSDLQSNLFIHRVSVQTDDGRYAGEAVDAKTMWNVSINPQQWRWSLQTEISHGEIYIEPIYHGNPEQPLVLSANGFWHGDDKSLTINDLVFTEPNIGHLAGNIRAKIDREISVEKATVTIASKNLQQLYSSYLQSFLQGTDLEGIEVTGALKGQVDFSEQSIQKISLEFPSLTVIDAKERISLQNGQAIINWSSQLET